ncbi:LysR family transcriptional regulator [Pseudoruegeria sp. SHC-113]|uniref:LysR family transcriptional regulator n=1 Tax=Pseudoruegeria sp. SHC-113 TaxID=2855439 RepID=UPI0021BAF165|nr:LysR family transcriptional regulator [Pseudoruegeria sp. SHC-113]MCT8161934.1 LysR family transcriptional regulator [Pseudoruegeria sp. SHC-113]
MDNSTPPDWTLWQSFLAVADTGSLSAAARQLGLSQPTLGRHIRQLETTLSLTLFARQARGLSLTAEAEALLAPARAMAEAAAQLGMVASGQAAEPAGTVRITASVMMAQHVLPPILAMIRQQAPEIELELLASDKSENLLFHEADIAVRMYRPTQLDIATRHLGDIALGLYAAENYIARRGMPANLDEALQHDWVGYDRSDLILRGMRSFGVEVDRSFFGIRCDNQPAYWQLVRAGLGIGAGQTFVARQCPEIRAVLPEVTIPPLPVWLSVPQSLRHSPRVRRVYDLLSEGLTEVVERG